MHKIHLLKKDSEFLWICAQEAAFEKLTTLIAFAGTLAYFDASKSVTLEVSLGTSDLGAVLMQNEKACHVCSKVPHALREKTMLKLKKRCMP